MQPVITLNDTEIRNYLARIADKLKTPAKLLQPIVSIYGLKDIDKHFKEEMGDTGKWKERSDWTQQYYMQIKIGNFPPPAGQSRVQYNPANKILQMTGALRESFVPGSVTERDSHSVMIKSNIDYSKKHDEGDPKERLPARPFMWMSDNAMKLMARALLNSIAGDEN